MYANISNMGDAVRDAGEETRRQFRADAMKSVGSFLRRSATAVKTATKAAAAGLVVVAANRGAEAYMQISPGEKIYNFTHWMLNHPLTFLQTIPSTVTNYITYVSTSVGADPSIVWGSLEIGTAASILLIGGAAAEKVRNKMHPERDRRREHLDYYMNGSGQKPDQD